MFCVSYARRGCRGGWRIAKTRALPQIVQITSHSTCPLKHRHIHSVCLYVYISFQFFIVHDCDYWEDKMSPACFTPHLIVYTHITVQWSLVLYLGGRCWRRVWMQYMCMRSRLCLNLRRPSLSSDRWQFNSIWVSCLRSVIVALLTRFLNRTCVVARRFHWPEYSFDFSLLSWWSAARLFKFQSFSSLDSRRAGM